MVRNYLYDEGHLRSVRFDLPVIGVGNLRMGGTGKSPHVAFIVEQLLYLQQTAVLSRGYGRRSRGFLIASETSSAAEIGDEARQLKKRFPETVVVVSEDRVMAVPRLLENFPETDVVLLDDAFQHRAIRPGLSILLTEYDRPFWRDSVFPLGWLREHSEGSKRADIIVVTKCPHRLTEKEGEAVLRSWQPQRYQKIYYSAYTYGALRTFPGGQPVGNLPENTTILLVSGIADYRPLELALKERFTKVYVRDYPDHHRYDAHDFSQIVETFNNLGAGPKAIITTEKDAARLEPFCRNINENHLPVYVQPVSVTFLFNGASAFVDDVQRYIAFEKQRQTQSREGE